MRAGFLRIMKQRGGPILIKNINTVGAAGSKRAATRVTGCGGGTSDPCPPWQESFRRETEHRRRAKRLQRGRFEILGGGYTPIGKEKGMLQGLTAGGADQEEGSAADQTGQQLTGGVGDPPGSCTGSAAEAAGRACRAFLLSSRGNTRANGCRAAEARRGAAAGK